MSYLVYKHTAPNGKVYVGLTSKSNPNDRWLDGKGYVDSPYFYRAILKYGWDNIDHEILASDLSCEDACQLEIDLIAFYDSTNPLKGYNIAKGGQYQPEEVISKISNTLKGHDVSEVTRKKIGDANRGKKRTKPVWNKGKHLSEEHKAKLRGKTSWAKGLTKETDSRIHKLSESMKGRTFSEEHKKNLRDSIRNKHNSGYSPIWITDGKIEHIIDISTTAIPDGWYQGRLNHKDVYVYRGVESKKISIDELDYYLSLGWKRGRSEDAKRNIQQSRRSYTYYYDGIKFERAVDVSDYLNTHGYPEIVSSTITAMLSKGYSDKYPDVLSKLSRIRNEGVKI